MSFIPIITFYLAQKCGPDAEPISIRVPFLLRLWNLCHIVFPFTEVVVKIIFSPIKALEILTTSSSL